MSCKIESHSEKKRCNLKLKLLKKDNKFKVQSKIYKKFKRLRIKYYVFILTEVSKLNGKSKFFKIKLEDDWCYKIMIHFIIIYTLFHKIKVVVN